MCIINLPDGLSHLKGGVPAGGRGSSPRMALPPHKGGGLGRGSVPLLGRG